MHELLKEYTWLVGQIAQEDYLDSENKLPELVKLREEIDRRLKLLDLIIEHSPRTFKYAEELLLGD